MVKQLFHLGRPKLWLLYTVYRGHKKKGKTPPAGFTSSPLRHSQTHLLACRGSLTPGQTSLGLRKELSGHGWALGRGVSKCGGNLKRCLENTRFSPPSVLLPPLCREGSRDLRGRGLLAMTAEHAWSPTSLEVVMKVEELLSGMHSPICELGSPN